MLSCRRLQRCPRSWREIVPVLPYAHLRRGFTCPGKVKNIRISPQSMLSSSRQAYKNGSIDLTLGLFSETLNFACCFHGRLYGQERKEIVFCRTLRLVPQVLPLCLIYIGKMRISNGLEADRKPSFGYPGFESSRLTKNFSSTRANSYNGFGTYLWPPAAILISHSYSPA